MDRKHIGSPLIKHIAAYAGWFGVFRMITQGGNGTGDIMATLHLLPRFYYVAGIAFHHAVFISSRLTQF